MSFKNTSYFTKENLDIYLKDLAKEFRRLNGKHVYAEIILIGGASIIINYDFRNTTNDVDALIQATASMKEAINHTADKFNLPNYWLNSDFSQTSSYSPKLQEVSKHYKTYANRVEYRTIDAEYLIAMKLMAGRKYKNDLSDIVGILKSHEDKENPITLKMIEEAVKKLYGSWDALSLASREFIEKITYEKNYEELFETIKIEEQTSHEIIIDFNQKNPKVLKESNLEDILNLLKHKK